MRKLAFLLILICALQVKADTIGQIHQSIFNRGLYFDQKRFDTLVTIDFVNDIQRLMATIGMTNERRVVFAMLEDTGAFAYAYALPTSFIQIKSAVMNEDPNLVGDPKNKRYTLKYTKVENIGRKSTASTIGRPKEYSIWDDTLYVQPTSNFDDTLTVYYFDMPVPQVDTSTTIDIPNRFVPSLKEITIQMCIERIRFPNRSPRQEGLIMTELVRNAVLGRPDDDT